MHETAPFPPPLLNRLVKRRKIQKCSRNLTRSNSDLKITFTPSATFTSYLVKITLRRGGIQLGRLSVDVEYMVINWGDNIYYLKHTSLMYFSVCHLVHINMIYDICLLIVTWIESAYKVISSCHFKIIVMKSYDYVVCCLCL